MKTTLSKIALIVIGVISVSTMAANNVASPFTGTHIVGDNNTVQGNPRPGYGPAPNVITGYNNNLTDTDSTNLYGNDNTTGQSDIVLMGASNTVYNTYGNIFGDVNQVNASNDGTGNYGQANVFGTFSKVSGAENNVFGSQSSVTGAYNTTVGNQNSILGSYNNVTGFGNSYGSALNQTDRANIYGTQNKITGSPYSNIIGSENNVYDIGGDVGTASSDYSNVIGNKNTVGSGAYTITIGNGNVNNGSWADSGGVSIGSNNVLTNAKDGTVIGNLSSSTGANSLVFGSSAHASNGGVSIGFGSNSSQSDEVSFGNSGFQRRLTNVAAGVNDTDVSNVRQMRDGDASTLSSAKGYTDSRETVINSRMDSMLAQEKSNRITGDADTLAQSGKYTDKQTAVAISTANSYTNAREQAINSRTDGLIADESSQRITGDAQTLYSANNYTNNQVSNERQARIEGDRNTLNSARAYTNERVDKLNDRVNRNERRANGGISAAMAMSSIPYLNYVDNSLGMATSTYRGETAIAAGLQSQISAMTNFRVNASWDTGGGVGIAAGMAVGW
ncbi:adhesin YadB/C [Pantoea ananatis]|uniref:YadA-like family protein n=1 Tax=Pantoea ananas TaxID=553 RepID=UPI0027854B34|nr:YadA-like family protein [Pantoea ananatis]MDQ1228436.1 adhesin YadB/C [Pantoea ananatis]